MATAHDLCHSLGSAVATCCPVVSPVQQRDNPGGTAWHLFTLRASVVEHCGGQPIMILVGGWSSRRPATNPPSEIQPYLVGPALLPRAAARVIRRPTSSPTSYRSAA